MTYIAAKVAAFLLAPANLLLILFAAGTLLLFTRRRFKTGRALVVLCVLAWAVIGYTPLVPVLLASLEDRYPASPPLPEQIDGIVVLGGAVDQTISQARGQSTLNAAGSRMIEAARLALAHPEAKVVVSGGNADPWHPEIKEAAVMAKILTDLGVAPDRVVQENRSRDTRENARFTQAIVKPMPDQHWILVTSAFHMPRSVGVFRQIGWSVIPWPSDYRTGGAFQWVNLDLPAVRLTQLFLAVHEWGGLIAYRVLGRTDSLLP